MNRRDKQLLLTSKKLRALVPPFCSFRKEEKKISAADFYLIDKLN